MYGGATSDTASDHALERFGAGFDTHRQDSPFVHPEGSAECRVLPAGLLQGHLMETIFKVNRTEMVPNLLKEHVFDNWNVSLQPFACMWESL